MFEPSLQKLYYPNDPVQAAKNIFGEATDRQADVIIDGGQPAIWPDEKRQVTVTAQPITPLLSYHPDRVLQILDEGMKLPDPVAVLAASKLKLAIDLYCLSHFRSSDFARFLVLCTVLETAAPEPTLSQACMSLIDKWTKQAQDPSNGRDDGEREEIAHLVQRLQYLKKQSHRSRIYQYVKRMLEMGGHPDAGKLALEARDRYDQRSALSHKGKYDLGDGLTRLDDIVCKTLKAAMRHSPGEREQE